MGLTGLKSRSQRAGSLWSLGGESILPPGPRIQLLGAPCSWAPGPFLRLRSQQHQGSPGFFVSGQLISNVNPPFPGNRTHRFQSLGCGHLGKPCGSVEPRGSSPNRREKLPSETRRGCRPLAPCARRSWAPTRRQEHLLGGHRWAAGGLALICGNGVPVVRVCGSPQKGQRGQRGSRRVPVLSREWQPQPAGLLHISA